MSQQKTFARKAPIAMRRLMRDFSFDVLDAAAIMGNAGYESGGLTIFQEMKPTVRGSRGGFGWFQWTGPRRVAFERYCRLNGWDIRSDRANYGFLAKELIGPERKAVSRTKRAVGLKAKVVAFEKAFERSGIKNYGSRVIWARRALDAWNKQQKVAPKARVTALVGTGTAVTAASAASYMEYPWLMDVQWWWIAAGVVGFIMLLLFWPTKK